MTKIASDVELTKIWDMIKHIKVAMLTSDDGGYLRARPMVAVHKEFAGELFFFTRASSPKVGEVQQTQHVNVSYADADHQNYVSLSGTATVTRDTAMIAEHWSEALRTWFPHGKTDPDIAILKVSVVQAEYWDAPSSSMVYLYGYAKAALTGKAPHPGENENVRIA